MQCHASANCIQQTGGYCCECDHPSFFGNGAECLPADGPLRINGVFEAALNGKQVQRTDLFGGWAEGGRKWEGNTESTKIRKAEMTKRQDKAG